MCAQLLSHPIRSEIGNSLRTSTMTTTSLKLKIKMGTHPIFLDINKKREFNAKLCHELQE